MRRPPQKSKKGVRIESKREGEEKIKGYLGIQFLEEEVEILGIGVNPEFRRKKIASDLMEHFIKYFETSKYKRIIHQPQIVFESNHL